MVGSIVGSWKRVAKLEGAIPDSGKGGTAASGCGMKLSIGGVYTMVLGTLCKPEMCKTALANLG